MNAVSSMTSTAVVRISKPLQTLSQLVLVREIHQDRLDCMDLCLFLHLFERRRWNSCCSKQNKRKKRKRKRKKKTFCDIGMGKTNKRISEFKFISFLSIFDFQCRIQIRHFFLFKNDTQIKVKASKMCVMMTFL